MQLYPIPWQKLLRIIPTIIWLFSSQLIQAQILDKGFKTSLQDNLRGVVLVEDINHKILFLNLPETIGSPLTDRFRRLNENGSIDAEFLFNIGKLAGTPRTCLPLANGGVLLGGLNLGTNQSPILQFQANGTPDQTYNNNIAQSFENIEGTSIAKIVQLNTGQSLLLAEGIEAPNEIGVTREDSIIAVNDRGELQASFKFLYYSNASDWVLQSGLRILMVGATLDSEIDDLIQIFRLRATNIASAGTGSVTTSTEPDTLVLDSRFQANVINGAVKQILVLEDSSALISGNFNVYGSNVINRLALIEPEGGLNLENFKFRVSEEGRVDHMARQQIAGEEKILLAGKFPNQISSLNALIRLNADGSIDPSFSLNFNIDQRITRILVTDSNDIILNGDFPGSLVRFLTPVAPLSPDSLRASSIFGREVVLTWRNNFYADSLGQTIKDSLEVFYVVERAFASKGDFETLAIIPSSDTSFTRYTDTDNIRPGIQYFYRVRAINTGNASFLSDEVSIVITDLITGTDEALSNQIKIYPNPGGDRFYLDLSQLVQIFPQALNLEIYDNQGHLVMAQALKNLEAYEIPAKNLTPGLYIIHLSDQHKTIQKRWLKQE